MSAFVPLNVEPAEDIVDDVDDTKEIQIEEALKLYQNALKLHSQGPEYYNQADEAYKALFQSDIFKYPEAISEYKRDQLSDFHYEDVYLPDEDEGDVAPDTMNTVSNALPQTIFLCYKNHAQFILDYLKWSLGRGDRLDHNELIKRTTEALEDFAEALERDDTDAELWRKSSRVGAALKSRRIARFCLESVLDSEIHEAGEGVGQLGLERIFAVKTLHQILDTLQDRLSSTQIPFQRPKKSIARLFSKQADIYPYLPNYSTDATLRQVDNKPRPCQIATAHSSTWAEVGAAILKALIEVDDSLQASGPLRVHILGSQSNDTSPSTLPIHPSKTSDDSVDGQFGDNYELEASDADIYETVAGGDQADLSPKDTSKSSGEKVTENNEGTGEEAHETMVMIETTEQKFQQCVENVSPHAIDENGSKVQSRKRSSTSVANEEQMDGGRAKSRRIRARESIAEAQAHQEDVVFDQTKYFEDQLERFIHADQWMFSTTGALLSKLGIEELGSIDELKHILGNPDGDDSFVERYPESVSMLDLREAIENWSGAPDFSNDLFTSHDGSTEVRQSGLSLFLERSRQTRQVHHEKQQDPDDEGLASFLQSVNSGYLYSQQVAFNWLERNLVSYLSPTTKTDTSAQFQPTSFYSTQPWSRRMKDLVKELISYNDEYMYRHLLSKTCRRLLDSSPTTTFEAIPSSVVLESSSAEFVQSIYELHLDTYASMSSPNSDASGPLKTAQRDRLRRWESLARTMIDRNMQLEHKKNEITSLTLRHLWSTIMHISITEEADREYVLACLMDLKQLMKRFGEPVIALVNNATMPELSASAVEQELARMSSMAFFMRVFGPGKEDPVSLIESIEPILDPTAIEHFSLGPSDERSSLDFSAEIQRTRDLAFFLNRGDATLKLLLWRRLQRAYESIQYPTKVISCSLRCIEIIVEELSSSTYRGLPKGQRRETLLRWLHRVDYLMLSIIGKIIDDPKGAFECIDMEHLQSSMAAIARLSKLLHAFVLYEDSVRIGQTSPPEIRPAAAAKAYEYYKEKLRSMLVRVWTLQYTLFREAIEQNKELFDMPSDDCINFLRSVHNALGIRSYCRYANKLLLKVMKHELLTLDVEDSYESDIAQVLYDYYGLKFSPELDISLEHGCPTDRLDKVSAFTMVDFAMLQVNRMNIKDFLKSDLKSTVDTIQNAIGSSIKTYPALTHNKRVISAFLKSPINPSNLYRAVQGISELSVVSVNADSYTLAEKGWYFLLGFAAFTRFKTQKRLGPMVTEDLDLAATFFRRELEHGVARWETWYRLAQVYDARLEEDITWTAEKLNTIRPELALLERRAIHSYSMAIAMAISTADTSPETKKTISELYTQFGFRIYASSREPFSMAAFSLDDFARHFSNDRSQEMYKGPPFRDMKLYSAWHFAGYLFRKAMVDRPMNWM